MDALADQTDKPAAKATDETVIETLESIVIAFILAFVFRAYVVEAFVIPTGSMAPTLLGAHVGVTCDQCGYEFTFDPPKSVLEAKGRVYNFLQYPLDPDPRGPYASYSRFAPQCPMCHYRNTVPARTPLGSGDRILVQKYIYSFSQPRRWDVVVFKAPHDPELNYIKRLVGLPREQLHLFEGNIYVRPTDAAGDDAWTIARKTDRPTVQRAVWQPIYHSRYVPLDEGLRSSPQESWAVPWQPAQPEAWEFDGSTYRYLGRGDGVLRFTMNREPLGEPNRLLYPYNQDYFGEQPREPVEDIRLAAHLRATSPDTTLRLASVARLDNESLDYGPERLTATVRLDGRVSLEAAPLEGDAEPRILDHARINPLPLNRTVAVEMWYVDQEASLWVEGRRVLRWAYELPLTTLRERTRPEYTPAVSIELSGSRAELHNVELDRDLYYASTAAESDTEAVGALDRDGASAPLVLGENDFFCVGDNSPRSYDGRFWGTQSQVDPWVRDRMLLHRDDPEGVVPRQLLMGRAFFVYFPAPKMLRFIPIPNFGDMRFIR